MIGHDFNPSISGAFPAGSRFPGFSLTGRSAANNRDNSRRAASIAGLLPPEVIDWLPVLTRLKVELADILRIAAQAKLNQTTFVDELVASGIVDQELLYRAVAAKLGLPFASEIDPTRLLVTEDECVMLLRARRGPRLVRVERTGQPASLLIVPDRIGELKALMARHRDAGKRLQVTTPGRLRAALFKRASPLLARRATRGLFERFPAMSALIVANAWQGFLVGAAIATLPVAFVRYPAGAFLAIHLFFSFFFLACVGLRFAAIRTTSLAPAPVAAPAIHSEMPVYSVLVALHREANVVPQLIAALKRLSWPTSKLEIKLVCEQDDTDTIAAICAEDLPARFEIVEVPPSLPRTKPKALAYALPTVTGEFVVLYDAEDRPDPLQLVEAWHRFRESGSDLACLQAPLEIANGGEARISRMFAFEYAALFRGLLPWLARKRLLLPLGGTSNHFRRSVLEEVGGWDPYNVTEDADLGLRLARFGYRSETISRPTYEDAPTDFKVWLPQRTRWFKGWCQTWLVHMRNPFGLARELGFGSFVIAQILFAGMILSAIAHPLLVVTAIVLAVTFAFGHTLSTWQSVLLIIDSANIACGYLSFLLLGWQTLKREERRDFRRIVLFTPVYWVMLSVAALRALRQLCKKPHLWEKTPHQRSSQSSSPLTAPSTTAGRPPFFTKSVPSPRIRSSMAPIASRSRPV